MSEVCNCCERPTAEPLHHAEEGDAYCGRCVADLLSVEVAQLREASANVADAYYRWATAEPGSRAQAIAHADIIDSAAELRLALSEGRVSE